MLNLLSASLESITRTIILQFPFVISVIGLLWAILFVNFLLRHRLLWLGIYPRHVTGLVGIVFAPFLHRDANHLFFNSIPLFLLMNCMLISGITLFYQITLFILVTSGLAIWLLGRRAIHVGASYIIMGYFGYLLVQTLTTHSLASFGVGLVIFYYFGSMLFSWIPTEEKISWEGHLFGLISGVAAALIYGTI